MDKGRRDVVEDQSVGMVRKAIPMHVMTLAVPSCDA